MLLIDQAYSQLNDQGMELFTMDNFQEALVKFNQVIADYQKSGVSEENMGTALWGKTLCDAALEYEEDFNEDVAAVECFFLVQHGCKEGASQRVQWFDRPLGAVIPDQPVQFADPNEKLSIRDCVDRVSGTAEGLRAGVIACFKRREVAWTLNKLITSIEEACIRCCNSGAFWTTCVSPIIAKFQKWRTFGVPDDPAWD